MHNNQFADSSNAITAAFNVCIETYRRIFDNYYPSHNSIGFTERNLTCNFVGAIQSLHPNDSFSWYEAPLDSKGIKHADAVTYIPSKNTMLIIESKRFSNLKQKIREFENDIDRIRNIEHINTLKKGLVNKFEVKHAFGIILADIWLETKGKREWFNNWDDTCKNTYGADLTHNSGFESIPHDWSVKENYKILLAAFALQIP